ncbi:MAG: hypothetical protein EOO77_03820 [Oxalobacteraceae bacterium]|nr:MAG: hypothetical protein EOO77_03820 [Oxalobacteraceae bacterium]
MTHPPDHAERARAKIVRELRAKAKRVASAYQDTLEWRAADMLEASSLRDRDAVVEAYREALEEIAQSVDAYPESVFVEPDMTKAHALLVAGGMTLDAVSASNMRHIAHRLGEVARAALHDAKEAGE